jgi:hypothetical protein
VESGSFPFRYQTGGGGRPRGKDSEASDVPAEIARPSAELCWTAPCRERPGRKRRWRNQRTSLTPGDERESRGEALTAVYLSHRVSAGPKTARTRCSTGVLGEGFDSYAHIHHHHARRRRERCAWSVLWDWARGRGTCRGSHDERVGPRRQVRERWQLEDQHRQRLLRWRAVRYEHLERARRENVRQPGPPGN